MSHEEESHRRAREVLFGKDGGGKISPRRLTRAGQTKIIILTAVGAVAAIIGWQEFSRDYSAMDPRRRCEFWAFRYQHGWGSEMSCKSDMAAAALLGKPFPENNPFPN